MFSKQQVCSQVFSYHTHTHVCIYIITQSLLDEDDPRINFAFLSHDEEMGGFDSDNAYCHQSSDAVNPYTACYRNPGMFKPGREGGREGGDGVCLYSSS
jgi:hypothetical protein